MFKNTVKEEGEEIYDLFARITQACIKYIKSILSVIYKLGIYALYVIQCKKVRGVRNRRKPRVWPACRIGLRLVNR